MASEVEICNSALQKIGAIGRITSLTQDDPNARAVNSCYKEMRDAEIEAHRWVCSIKRVQLSPDVETEPFYSDHVYTLPADCMHVILPRLLHLDWHIEGGKIITADAGPINVTYVRRVTDPNEMPATLRELIACRIAVQICQPVTQSNTKLKSVAEMRTMALQEARRTNAFQKVGEHPDDAWIDARR